MRSATLAVLALSISQPVWADAASPGAAAAWSPTLVGALIGVVSVLMLAISKKPIGVSTSYARISGMIGRAVAPRHVDSLPFFQKTRPEVEWEVMLLIGIVIGAAVAAWSGGELVVRWLPPLWAARFGSESVGLRLLTAFGGGLLMAFGARIAGGCTSGHGIGGAEQMSVGSWIALVCFFAGGLPVALWMFGR